MMENKFVQRQQTEATFPSLMESAFVRKPLYCNQGDDGLVQDIPEPTNCRIIWPRLEKKCNQKQFAIM